jgi:hypothetical protein
MFFWKRKRGRTDTDQAVLVRGGKQLALQTGFRTQSRRSLRSYRPGKVLSQIVAGPISANSSGFDFRGSNRGDFYRWLRDSIPVISAGVWAWVRLCATEARLKLTGSASARLDAETAIAQLDSRILEAPYGRGSGLEKLTEACFLELFTTGRFCGQAVLSDDGRSIDHFTFIDPYRVGWEHTDAGWIPFVTKDEFGKSEGKSKAPGQTEVERFDPRLFFYATLGSDLTNPGGIEPLATIPFVAEIEQLMLEDMARSSHNAGTPRLQVKIGRPPRFDFEDDQGYISRANTFFESLVSQFQNLEPDDNLFTWDDVEVTVVGGSGKQWEWRLNRDQVIEDVITGLKLFPWVLGRTHKTTQNWVQSQYDFLMQMVDAHQRSGLDLIDWLCNLELELKGIDAAVRHDFSHHADPFRLERAQAERVEIDNANLLVDKGFITHEEAARRLGITPNPQASAEPSDAGGS